MKVYVHCPQDQAPVPWSVDRLSIDFHEHCACVTCTPSDADVVWLLSNWTWRSIPINLLRDKKVVTTIHHVVPERIPDKIQDFHDRDEITDCYHVPCQQTYRFVRRFTKKPVQVIGYWISSKQWYPQSKSKCREHLGLPSDDFIVGSFQRDTDSRDLVSPKREKGPDIFCYYVERLRRQRSNIRILLGAWQRQYVMNRLGEAGVPFSYFELAPLDVVRKMYSACDLYVVSSRYEGGPLAILEAGIMRVPIVSNDVGMATHVLSRRCVIDLENDMYFPDEEDIQFSFEGARRYEMRSHMQNFLRFFQSL